MIVQLLDPTSIGYALRRHLQGSSTRRNERLALLQSYSGVGIEGDVTKYFPREAMENSPVMKQRIARKLIDARAVAYKDKPERTADEKYLEKIGDIDAAMLELDRMTKLLGTVALLRRYDTDLERLIPEVVTIFEPIWLEGEADPSGIAYPLSGEYAKAEDQLWAVWTADAHFLANRSGETFAVSDDNPDKVNPYGVLPVVWSHNGANLGSWWRAPASDIANAQTSFNVIGTQLMLGAMFQSLGQPVASGINDRDELNVGPYNLWKLPEGARFDFATPTSDLTRIIAIQRWVVESAAYTNHLTIKWAEGGGATSGEHQRILEVDLTEAVMSDFHSLRVVENDRFAIDREILAVFKINIEDKYHVNFAEPHIPLSAAEERADWEWKWTNNLASKQDWFNLNDPDRTPEEVQAERLAEEPPASTPLTALLNRKV
jgi:hypothetical protein